ncbi:MAG: lipocalin family protein [Granulosicoccus sp.]
MNFRCVVSSVFLLFLTACGGLPKGINPVDGFDVNRYLGTWYEVARLDHRFERGLSNVSAQYSLQENGTVRVVNRGYNIDNKKFTEAVGRARFVGETDEGYLEVSFFGPFFGSYVVFELDADYRHAYVAGNNRSNLWFLSRTPTVSQAQMDAFVAQAKALGFPVEQLIFVDQSLAR